MPQGAGPAADRALRWERRTSWWLVGLAVAFLVLYAVPVLWPELPAVWRSACRIANVVVWFLFWVDYLVRWALAGNRREFVRGHLFDLAVLVLPLLRPLRLLRLLTALMVADVLAEVRTLRAELADLRTTATPPAQRGGS